MTFQEPLYFLLFVPLVMVFVHRFFRQQKKIPTIQFSHLGTLKDVPRGVRARLAFVPDLFKLLSLSLAIIALARPQEANTRVKKNIEGIDIMLVLDISDSMLIEDMTPENRLGAAKKTIQDFISARASDRIGLVVFSGESYTRVPLTLDYSVLLQSIEEVEPTKNLKMGTAIGVALANGVSRLRDSTAKSRIVILLTDGENNSGTIAPETSLEIAKGFGIKVYTIGIGLDGPTQLPVFVTDPFGRKIKTYQPFSSTVNDDLLTRIAEETNGKYFRASKTQVLQNVFREIDRLEKTKIDIDRYVKYQELFQTFLRWSIIFFLLSFFLSRTFLRRAP